MRLVELRAKRLLSIRALAQKAEVSQRTVHTVERGLTKPTLETVRKLSEALEIDPREVDEFRAAIESTIRGAGSASAEKASPNSHERGGIGYLSMGKCGDTCPLGL